jgi:hypothetical protein
MAQDWRLLPKGSPERKAAVRVQRQKLAAAARETKAAKAQGLAGSPESDDGAALDVGVGERKLSYQELIEWVWEHLGEARCPPAPNRKAQELWRYAKKNRDGFLDKYVPLLIKKEHLDEGKKKTHEEELADDPYWKTLKEFQNENGWGDPPHDWNLNYQDARYCPLRKECPAIKAAIEQAKRAAEQGQRPHGAPCGSTTQQCPDVGHNGEPWGGRTA